MAKLEPMFLCCLLLLAQQVLSSEKRYDGYHVLTVYPETSAHVEQLAEYFDENDVDVWNFPRSPGGAVMVSVPSEQLDDVIAWLDDAGIQVDIRSNDLQRMIEQEAAVEAQARAGLPMSRTGGPGFNLTIYQDHDEINAFLRDTAAGCDICQTITLGRSHEGREMLILKIGQHQPGKSSIWIQAGIHAREWIAPATALNIIHKLVDGHRTGDPDAVEMLESYVWYILPSANPDGYMYSRTSDRMWRKTRTSNQGSSCVGTDPNRNWDYHWDEAGTSRNPCSQIYSGSRAFSEKEPRLIANFLLKKRREIKIFLSFHSYGQWWLLPWAYADLFAEDHEELMRVGGAAVDSIREVHGTEFTLGATAHILYAAAGSSGDWAKGVAGIKYAYVAELRDTGYHGFLLPPDQIRPVAEEMWAGVVAMARAANQ